MWIVVPQAIVGAVPGIGMIKGLYTVNNGTLLRIGAGWPVTPILSLLISSAFLGAIK